nr:unnamed protein product [Digitaria exilis]
MMQWASTLAPNAHSGDLVIEVGEEEEEESDPSPDGSEIAVPAGRKRRERRKDGEADTASATSEAPTLQKAKVDPAELKSEPIYQSTHPIIIGQAQNPSISTAKIGRRKARNDRDEPTYKRGGVEPPDRRVRDAEEDERRGFPPAPPIPEHAPRCKTLPFLFFSRAAALPLPVLAPLLRPCGVGAASEERKEGHADQAAAGFSLVASPGRLPAAAGAAHSRQIGEWVPAEALYPMGPVPRLRGGSIMQDETRAATGRITQPYYTVGPSFPLHRIALGSDARRVASHEATNASDKAPLAQLNPVKPRDFIRSISPSRATQTRSNALLSPEEPDDPLGSSGTGGLALAKCAHQRALAQVLGITHCHRPASREALVRAAPGK